MPTSPLQFWVQFITILGAIVGAVLWLNRRFNQLDERFTLLERRLDRIEVRLGAVEHQNRALLKAFPSVISVLMSTQLMPADQGSRLIAAALETPPIDQLMREVAAQGNPLTLHEIARLRQYIQRLKLGEPLLPDEVRDFYALSDTLTREYPAQEGSWLLFLVGGILLGLILAGPKKS